MALRRSKQEIVSGLLATLFLCAVVWACSSSPAESTSSGGPDTETDGAPSATPDSAMGPGADGAIADGAKVDGAKTDGASPVDGATEEDADVPDGFVPPVLGATAPNLKVAFIGDTGTSNDFKSVLQLIVRENADMVMIQGDLTYGLFTSASDWFSVIDNQINKTQPGSSALVTIPYFVAKGNHDSDWAGLGSGLKARMASWGIASENGDPTTKNYSVVHKGLKMVMVDESETNPTRAAYVTQRLQGDTHIWKICSWHKNMRATNVGPKSDEMGWGIYENCRAEGAIVAQAHSHTYSRSKTVTNDTNQTVDGTCNDPFAICVGPGKHFFFDSSLGGEDTRSLDSVANKPYWASTYTGSFGALFITFNVGGDPKMAEGYFKTTADVVIDPPAASGKTTFTITKTP